MESRREKSAATGADKHEGDGDESRARKRIRIQRRRLGKIAYINEEKSYGFIHAEDFRDDVFFHLQDWDSQPTGDASSSAGPPEVGMWIEFELNDEHFEVEKRLRAKVVRPTDRPTGRKLSGRDATFKIVTHHRNARRKRPSWRK